MLAKTLVDHHYKRLQDLAFALADALAEQVRELDADVVQVDEANLPGSPDEWTIAAEAINRVLRAVKSVPAVHLCFGNYGGQSIQSGTWGKLIDYLNALEVDHIVMETAHRPAHELEVFRGLRPEIGFGLGGIDIKSTEIERADDIARAIERAEKTLGPGRVTYVHPDCGFWMLKRNIADGKLRVLVAGRDRYEGRGAWPRPLRRVRPAAPDIATSSDDDIIDSPYANGRVLENDQAGPVRCFRRAIFVVSRM